MNFHATAFENKLKPSEFHGVVHYMGSFKTCCNHRFSWAGGPPSNLTRGTPTIDEENEIGFLNADEEGRGAGNPRSPTPSFRERPAKVQMKNDFDQRMSRVHGK